MTPWDRATTALALLALDPGLGGIRLRARAGPVRDAVLAAADALPLPALRLHPAMTPDQIDGGIDLSATLETGTLTRTRGLLSGAPSVLTLAMAERVEPYLASRLAAALDGETGHLLLALDEGCEDEALPDALSDRLAFHLYLDGLSLRDIGAPLPLPTTDPASVTITDTCVEKLITVAVRLGIPSLRAAGLALRAAKAHAALMGRTSLAEDDFTAAVTLVLAPRATQLPAEEDDQPPPPDPDQQKEDPTDPGQCLTDLPDELLLDAVETALPPDMLDKLTTGSAPRTATGAGTGARKIGNRRGRPLPARNTRTTRSDARVDLMATLRAALPWQTMRAKARPDHKGAHIRPSDLRHKRYQSHSDRLLIFTVDASGSAAVARLGEAKGAVELLLGQAYARRDHVALVAFRGKDAELLLPPTRSLVQTKRRLASLPGGGGTPLAAGLAAAQDLAAATTRKGLTPTVVLLTDGRANIARDGTADRPQAAEDAKAVAQVLRGTGIQSIVIDTGNRPSRDLRTLAQTLDGRYLALPRADAAQLSRAVGAELDC